VAQVLYKDASAIHKFTEIILGGNKAITIPIGELTHLPDEMAALIPENIPNLTVIMGDGSPKGQTAEAVIKTLPNFSALSDAEAKGKEDGIASAKARNKKTPAPLVADFGNSDPITETAGL
jgi:hypothetical protein